MDLATATNAPETIDLAGEEHVVRQLTMKEWGLVTAYLKRQNPSPITRAGRAIDQAAADGEPLSAATRDTMLDHAQRAALNWPPRLGSVDWFETFERTDGGPGYLLHQVLSKTDPSIDLARCEVLAKRFSTADWDELIRVSLYGTPPRTAPKATGTA